ncbi:hypothetical protein GGX14DRAFT_385697 [Mycena pura]|uniref:Uncharacterized protein n=1 Tax=Mycena pura TaxID=153505 RepID=A0AAD6YQX1_9AGAR|nr:hypothetical protein GGX14DRAFT_385697 [Mycena pura]
MKRWQWGTFAAQCAPQSYTQSYTQSYNDNDQGIRKKGGDTDVIVDSRATYIALSEGRRVYSFDLPPATFDAYVTREEDQVIKKIRALEPCIGVDAELARLAASGRDGGRSEQALRAGEPAILGERLGTNAVHCRSFACSASWCTRGPRRMLRAVSKGFEAAATWREPNKHRQTTTIVSLFLPCDTLPCDTTRCLTFETTTRWTSTPGAFPVPNPPALASSHGVPPPRKCQSGANHGKWYTACFNDVHGHRYKFWDIGVVPNGLPAPAQPAQPSTAPLPPARATSARCASCPRTGNTQCPSRPCKTCCCVQSAVFCRVHESPLPPTLAATARQLPLVHLEPAPPRRRCESIAFPAPRPCKSKLPHERLAGQQETAARLAALTPLPLSPTLLQEARDEAPAISGAISLTMGTSPPPSVTTADTRRVQLHTRGGGPAASAIHPGPGPSAGARAGLVSPLWRVDGRRGGGPRTHATAATARIRGSSAALAPTSSRWRTRARPGGGRGTGMGAATCAEDEREEWGGVDGDERGGVGRVLEREGAP